MYTFGFEVGESNQKLKISIFNTSFNKKQKSIIGNIVNLRKNNFQSTSLCKKMYNYVNHLIELMPSQNQRDIQESMYGVK